MQQIQNTLQKWQEKFIAINNSYRLFLLYTKLRSSLEDLLEKRCYLPLVEYGKQIHQMTSENKSYLSQTIGEINSMSEIDLSKLEHIEKTFKVKSALVIEQLAGKNLLLGEYHSFGQELASTVQNISDLDKNLSILSKSSINQKFASPDEINVILVNVNSSINQNILGDLLPIFESQMEKINRFVEDVWLDLKESYQIVGFSLEALRESKHQEYDDIKSNIVEPLQKSQDRLVRADEEIQKLAEEIQGNIKLASENAIEELRENLSYDGFVESAGSRLNVAVGRFQQLYDSNLEKLRSYRLYWVDQILALRKGLEESNSSKVLHRKMRNGTLDAKTISDYLKEAYFHYSEIEMPKLYQKLFNVDALRDQRFLTNLKDFHIERDQTQSHPKTDKNILLVSQPGMGRTSLLNVLQMSNPRKKTVRIEKASTFNKTNILKLLADSLKCEESVSEILKALRQDSGIVIIDNLDHWWGNSNLSFLEQLFDIIVRSSSGKNRTIWMVSMTEVNFESFDQVFEIRSIFDQIVKINRLGANRLRKLIEKRHQLSGLSLKFPATLTRGWKTDFFQKGNEELFYRVLLERSHGNIRLALHLWTRSLASFDEQSVTLSMNRTSFDNFSFLSQINESSLLILKELYRFGPRSLMQLKEQMKIEASAIRRELNFLESASLIEKKSTRGLDYQIPSLITFQVGQSLKDMKYL